MKAILLKNICHQCFLNCDNCLGACMNTRSAFECTHLFADFCDFTVTNTRRKPLPFATSFFWEFCWGKSSGRDVFEYMFTTVFNYSSHQHPVINSLAYNERIIRILSAEWSQSDKMLFLTEWTKNNSSAHFNNFVFPLNHLAGLQCILS